MSQRVAVAYSGDLASEFLTSFGKDFDLVPVGTDFSTDLAVDGPSGTISRGVLEGFLDAGRSVLIALPTITQISDLEDITGQTCSQRLLAISYRKLADGRYSARFVPRGEIVRRSFTDDGSERTETSRPYEVSPSASWLALSDGAFDAAQGPSIAGFVPPPGSYAGYAAFSEPVAWNVGFPSFPDISATSDDNTMTSDTQVLNSQFLTEFYVYWVNGLTTTPYFIVIQRQSGTMDIGSMGANNSNSRGWFNAWFNVTSNVPVQNDVPVNGLTLIGHQPANSSPSPTQITVSVPMPLYARGASGPTTVSFSAQYQNTLGFPGWSIADQSSGSATAWQMSQSDVWNPVANPPADFSNWWKLVYNTASTPPLPWDAVVNLPATSMSSINFEFITQWQITPPAFKPPDPPQASQAPSCGVGFSGTWQQNVIFLHNWAGCHEIAGDHHHLFWAEPGNGWIFGFDIGALANTQNMAGA